jgi:hypothetical protein
MSNFLILLTACVFLGCASNSLSDEVYITDFGAQANDEQLDTEAIQKAIDFCQHHGGGTVIFPEGKYQSGTIQLRPNVSLQLDSGSIWQASRSLSDYDTIKKVSFLVGEGLEQIEIRGKGVIDGQGMAFWDDQYKPMDRPAPWIRLSHCRNIRIKGIRLQNAPSHTLRIENSDSIWISSLTIWNPLRGPNTDGIDVVDSRNVWIEGCFIRTGDDAICLKSSRGWVEQIKVSNCHLISDDAAIKFGTSSEVGVRNCRFHSIQIDSTRYGLALFMLEGGLYQDNEFVDIAIKNDSRHRYQYAIYVDVDRRTPQDKIGRIEGLTFKRLQIHTNGKVLMSGHPDQPLRKVLLQDIEYTYEAGVDFSKATKPRGNKNYPKLNDSYDFASRPESWVFAFVEQLQLARIHHANGQPLPETSIWQYEPNSDH